MRYKEKATYQWEEIESITRTSLFFTGGLTFRIKPIEEERFYCLSNIPLMDFGLIFRLLSGKPPTEMARILHRKKKGLNI